MCRSTTEGSEIQISSFPNQVGMRVVTLGLDHSAPSGRRPSMPMWRRRRLGTRIARNPLASSGSKRATTISKFTLLGLAAAILIGVFVATALVATGLTVVVANGWRDTAAALIPLVLSGLIFSGLGAMLRQWMRRGSTG